MILPKLDLPSLRAAYASGDCTPGDLLRALHEAIEAEPQSSLIWISRLRLDQLLAYAARIEEQGPDDLPLYGVPFAIKDNIDLAELPTTAACPDYSYRPEETAFVVQQLIEAGAIPIGKTNLDQFATGLVGVRSPYGAPGNAFDVDFIPGGSSAGSAVAVARGQVAFSLGTDTAGSGRIPAAFHDLVGHKPTRGLLSCSGVIPACRTLDCVTVFAHSPSDAADILEVAARFDRADSYARPRPASPPAPWPAAFSFGVPRDEDLEFFGNSSARGLFAAAVARLESIGGRRVTLDFRPFLDAARLLYEGPWVAERFVAIADILAERPEILHPVTRSIIEGGGRPAAADAFRAQYKLSALKRTADEAWDKVDLIVTPTAGTIYTIAQVEADPVQINSNLGYYTNFMNLLDYSATAAPAGFMDNGLPFGITLFAPAFQDANLLRLAGAYITGEPLADDTLPAGWISVAVCGTHMRGLPLNRQLTDRGGRFLREDRSSSCYRLYVLPPEPGFPDRPGLVRATAGGAPIDLEVWALPADAFGTFVAAIPHPLGIGKVELADRTHVSGFLCEPYAVEGGAEITSLGGWRSHLSGGGRSS